MTTTQEATPLKTIRLPYPPSVNRYWRSVQGRVLISKEGRKYRDQIQIEALMKRLRGKFNHDDRIGLRLEVYPPDRRTRDLDNVLKALLDSLTKAGVWTDDSQIDELQVVRGEMDPGKAGFVLLTTWRI